MVCLLSNVHVHVAVQYNGVAWLMPGVGTLVL